MIKKLIVFLMFLGISVLIWFLVGRGLFIEALLQEIKISEQVREYSWNQRVTLNVDTINGLLSSSSVLKVTWTPYSGVLYSGSRDWNSVIEGEMPFVIMPDDSVVVATMGNSINNLAESFLMPDKNIKHRVLEDDLRTIKESNPVSTKIVAGQRRFPYILAIEDRNNMSSISVYSGNSYLEVEKVNDAVSLGKIDEVLEWLNDLPTVSVRSMPTLFSLPNGGMEALYQSDIIGT